MFGQLSTTTIALRLKSRALIALDLTILGKYNHPTNKCDAPHPSTGMAKILDLALPIYAGKAVFPYEGRTIQVKGGRVKAFNASFLKSMKSGSSFQIFSNFPKELRLKVWGMAVEEEPRRITFREVSHPGGLDYDIYGAPCPNAILASHEAWEDAVKVTKRYKPMLEIPGSQKAVFFNPDLDIVWLNAAHAQPELILSEVLIDHVHASEIQHLRIDAGLIESEYDWAIDNIKTMSQLKSLRIEGTFRVSTRTRPTIIVMSFGEADSGTQHGCYCMGSRVMPRIKCDNGTFEVGMNAMRAINRHIRDVREQQRFMDLWMMLSRAVKTTKNFPTRTDVVFRYTH